MATLSLTCTAPILKVPRESQKKTKSVLHFPMEPQLHRLMTMEHTAPYFKGDTGLRMRSTDHFVRGLQDSRLWKERVIDTNFHLHDGNVVLMSSGDGAQVWKSKKSGKYSLFCVGSEVLNLPFRLMAKHRILHVIWPGPGAPREEVQTLLREIYVPEMV
jgi:hypothetical protein